MPTGPYGPDPGGLLFTTHWGEDFTKMAQTYKPIFTDVTALQSCSIEPAPFPAVVELTARFITATAVSYVGGGSSESASATSTAAVVNSESGMSQNGAPQPTPSASSGSIAVVTQTVHTVTSASLSTIVSQGTAGPVTAVNTVLVTNLVTSPVSGNTAVSTPTATNDARRSLSGMVWVVGFVALVLHLASVPGICHI